MNPDTMLWIRDAAKSLEEVRRHGTMSLICGERKASISLLSALGVAFSVVPTSITKLALDGTPVETESELMNRLEGHPLLFDVESICWFPWLHLDPIRLLRHLARHQGIVAVWPGQIAGHMATFSVPGRRDYQTTEANGINLLQPITARFPDEIPFSIERIKA